MPTVEDLKNLPKDASPQQKLGILQNESLVPITAIQGYAAIIKQRVNPELDSLPPDFTTWVDCIIECADFLAALRKWTFDKE